MSFLTPEQAGIGPDFTLVQEGLMAALDSDVPILGEVTGHLIQNSGKRLRPMITLLAAQLCGYTGREHIDVAVLLELIHTATLLHDDVVDEAQDRRNAPTANALWGNGVTILSGDYLYAKAFCMMSALSGCARVIPVLSAATLSVVEGEVMQLTSSFSSHLSVAAYFDIIERKTATLFRLSAQLGALLLPAPQEHTDALATYGHHLGLAFQMADDLLDYGLHGNALKRAPGQDLAEGKNTFPLIQALARSAPKLRAQLAHILESGQQEALPVVQKALVETGALAATQERIAQAIHTAQQALQGLPENPARTALFDLSEHVVASVAQPHTACSSAW